MLNSTQKTYLYLSILITIIFLILSIKIYANCSLDKVSGNTEELISVVNSPSFSKESGFYDADISVELAADSGCRILYSLDGHVPDETRGIIYDKPFLLTDASQNPNVFSAREDFSLLDYYIPDYQVPKANIVQAIAVDTNGNTSDVSIAVYWIDSHKKILSDIFNDIPVLSLTGDVNDLFGYENGILVLGKSTDDWKEKVGNFDAYVSELDDSQRRDFLVDYHIAANFNNRGDDWERKLQFDYFENGILKDSQKVGVRRRGKSSSVGQMKGFNIYCREKYGSEYLCSDLFGTGTPVERMSLKNAESILTDGFICSLIKDRENLISLSYKPVSLFLEGEYWGTYCLIEKWSLPFLQNHYAIKDGTIFKNEASKGVDTSEDFTKLIEWAKDTDLSNWNNYQKIIKKVDIQSLIDYYCVRIYIDDNDSEEKYNMMAWKPEYRSSTAYDDGKWHWALYDLDSSLLHYDCDNFFEEIRPGRRGFLSHDLIGSLLENDDFKKRFILSFCDILNYNFEPMLVLNAFDSESSMVEKALIRDRKRFYGDDTPEKVVDEKINDMRNFWLYRWDYVWKYLMDSMKLSDPVNITISLDSDMSRNIRINTSIARLDMGGGVLRAKYFPEYEIELSIEDPDCDTDVQWEIKSFSGNIIIKDSHCTVKPEEGMEIILHEGME